MKNLFKLKYQNWPGVGTIKKTSKHIWQTLEGQVTSLKPLLFFIVMAMKRDWIQKRKQN